MFPQLVGSRAKIEHLTELKIISDREHQKTASWCSRGKPFTSKNPGIRRNVTSPHHRDHFCTEIDTSCIVQDVGAALFLQEENKNGRYK